ncbi:phosphonopyruvate decarboxylase [Pseudomonas sp. B35(2017)]|uniref:phosphonopyruvate decarboxylase n=1 Tax=Pseudomonas sp. B35(2017) TaxID=1981722 RepID=UPI000A1DC35C|nr:phosphonopyruvate decarboxylase [Pseudomonas sp. B35(2017)]
MISPEFFYQSLKSKGVEYFAGTPDSLLKSFCFYVSEHTPASHHVIAANEGGAIGLAMGYHLATGGIPAVYMQNSGLGNAINPLLSLGDPDVYSIPMILIIGWRGEPGVKDEPQHLKQGRVTLALLEAMEIPYDVIDGDESLARAAISRAVETAASQSRAYALVVKGGAVGSFEPRVEGNKVFSYSREDVIDALVQRLDERHIVVATTGMISRELFECRKRHGQGHDADFLTIGGMGHASQIALEIATHKPDRQVICLDGDGALLMHMGSAAIAGTRAKGNFKHLVINNGAHDSVGGQPTVAQSIDLQSVFVGCGYSYVSLCVARGDLFEEIEWLLDAQGPALLEIMVDKGARGDLGRPSMDLKEGLAGFMAFVSD